MRNIATRILGFEMFKTKSLGGMVFVSPLAAFAFKLCVLGDTGLKTGWMRCRLGAGRGGAGCGRAGWLRTSLIVSHYAINLAH